MAVKLTLDSFNLSTATFEVRYEKAFLLWDSAGKIWTSLSVMFKTLSVDKAEPNVTSFIADNRYKISIQLDKFFIIDLKPKSSLAEFIKITANLSKVIIDFLKLDSFSRIGFRLVYLKKFEDKNSAANYFKNTKLVNFPDNKALSIEGNVVFPNLSYNWEGGDFSARILLQAREKVIDFDSPPDIEELESIHMKKNELLFDIDYFSQKDILPGQLDVKEWLSQAFHLIKRDSHVFLGS